MTKIIAEIGWNHMGDMELAKKMIDAARESGASYAKFQTWSVDRLKDGNEYLIKYCNDHFKTVYMSTGTSKWSELKDSVKLLANTRLVLMHCVSSYPAEYSSANISKLRFLKMLSPNIGYSDHIFGVESCKVAMAYGVEIVEKHFTIDRNLPGRDNKFAILPEEMKQLSDYIKMHDEMHLFHGLDFQPCEESSRDQYAGRFDK